MYSARNYTEIVKAYNLEILERPADWSIENGDLARTTDGDSKNGDDVYSALSRLVQLWCYNETHFRYLFDAAREMVEQHSLLANEIDDIGNKHATEAAANPLVNIDEFVGGLATVQRSTAMRRMAAGSAEARSLSQTPKGRWPQR
jgi:hypothetical protein